MSDGKLRTKNGGAFQVQIDPGFRRQSRPPELNLWAAVLFNGLKEATWGRPDAIEWLNSEEDSEIPQSYISLCKLLQINGPRLREVFHKDAKKFYRQLRNLSAR